MSRVRTYSLPSSDGERRALVERLRVMTTGVLGYPTRDANIARWQQMPIGELRRVCENWRALVESIEKKRTATSTGTPPLLT